MGKKNESDTLIMREGLCIITQSYNNDDSCHCSSDYPLDQWSVS